MVKMGYERVTVDHCIYMRTSIIGIHVDDMAAAVSTKEELISMKQDLSKVFDLVDLGEVQWLLGMGVKRDRRAWTRSLSQTIYIDKIATKLGLKNANPVHTPLNKNVIPSKSHCPTTTQETESMEIPIPHRGGIADVHCYGYSSRHRVCCCASEPVLLQPWARTLDGGATSHKIPHNHQAQVSESRWARGNCSAWMDQL